MHNVAPAVGESVAGEFAGMIFDSASVKDVGQFLGMPSGRVRR
jgi:hypothetical protein